MHQYCERINFLGGFEGSNTRTPTVNALMYKSLKCRPKKVPPNSVGPLEMSPSPENFLAVTSRINMVIDQVVATYYTVKLFL